MTVYILRSKIGVYVFSALLETKDFWLAPTKDGSFEIFGKDVFNLSIENAEEAIKNDMGFVKQEIK